MTFLQLYQRLHSEAARQGSTPTTVLSQTGMNLRLVNWILTAYEDIQSEHETWLFRRADFSFSISATKSNYTKTDAGVTDLAAWKFDPNDNYVSGIKLYLLAADETHLIYYPWDDFLSQYKFGSFRTQTGKPTVFSIKPDLSMELWPIPNAVFTVNGEYIKQMQTMTDDTDEPILPDHHIIIVWKALMYYGALQGAPEVYAHGEEEYGKLLSKLELNQLEKLGFGPPLA